MITLKDGNKTGDIRLDRIKYFDKRSRGYPIRRMVARKKMRSYTWRCNVHLDQGSEGACVGFGVAHELKWDALKILSFQDDKKGISANPCQDQPDLTLVCLWQAPGVLHHIMDQSCVLELVLTGLDTRLMGAR